MKLKVKIEFEGERLNGISEFNLSNHKDYKSFEENIINHLKNKYKTILNYE